MLVVDKESIVAILALVAFLVWFTMKMLKSFENEPKLNEYDKNKVNIKTYKIFGGV